MNDRRNIATINGRRKHLWIRLSIWSLKRHDHLISVLRMSMWSYSAVVLLAAVAGRLDLQAALRIIGFGGLSVVVLLTGLLLTRKNVLLSLEDPQLKKEAHHAMLDLMRAKSAGRLAKSEKPSPSAQGRTASCRHPGECA